MDVYDKELIYTCTVNANKNKTKKPGKKAWSLTISPAAQWKTQDFQLWLLFINKTLNTFKAHLFIKQNANKKHSKITGIWKRENKRNSYDLRQLAASYDVIVPTHL